MKEIKIDDKLEELKNDINKDINNINDLYVLGLIKRFVANVQKED